MKERLIETAAWHKNEFARQRAKRALRIRYGIQAYRTNPDPVWLSAYAL